MEAVGQQLTTLNAAVGELSDRLKQIESQLKAQEAKWGTKMDEMAEEIDGLRRELTGKVDKAEATDKLKAAELVTKINKEKIQSIESLSAEMFERIFHNESSLQLKMEHMSSTMAEIRNQMASTAQEINLQNFKKLKWTVSDLRNKVQQDNWECQSDIFKFFGSKYDIKANLKKDEKLSISLQFKDGSKINKFKDKLEFTTVKYTVRDQVKAHNGRDIIYESHLKFVEKFAQLDWIFLQQLPQEILCPPYVKDDCIKIEMLFEPPSIDRSFVSNNGVLKWTVDNFIIRNQGQWQPPIWSPSFYTSPRGYRVRINLLITHNPIIAQVKFFTGEHDASLSCIFPHKTTIILFNHTDPSKNLVKREKRKDVSNYVIQLESYQFLMENYFISHESILLEVVIEQLANKSVHQSQSVARPLRNSAES